MKFLLVTSAILSCTWASATDLIKNGNFNQEFLKWGHNRCHLDQGTVLDCKHEPDASSGETIESDLFVPSEKYLRMVRGDYQFQATYQMIGTLVPGTTYRLRLKAKTPVGSTIMVSLFNKDWFNTDGTRQGKAHTKIVESKSASWQTVEKTVTIPAVDDQGNPTNTNRWYLYLYSNLATPFIEYDQISLSPVNTPIYRNNLLADAEFIQSAQTNCAENTLRADGSVEPISKSTACSVTQSKLSESTSKIVFNGGESERLKRVSNFHTMSVKPDTLYVFSADIKYTNRKCYEVLKYGSNYWSTSNGTSPVMLKTEMERTHGVWCGNSQLNLFDPSPERMNGSSALTRSIGLLTPRVSDAPYLDEKDVPTFTESRIFRTSPDQVKIQLQLILDGFDGMVELSNLKLFEATESQVAPTTLVAPTTQFGGMKLVDYSANSQTGEHAIKTNAGEWKVSNNEIIAYRDGKVSGRMKFYPGTLSSLALIAKPATFPSAGRVELSNNRIRLQFYSDSTLSAILRKEQPVRLSGLEGNVGRSQKTFDAGVAVDLDLEAERGLFFTPMELNRLNQSNVEIYNKKRVDYRYPESLLQKTGFRFWDVNYTTTANGLVWNQITYHFKRLDTFMAAILPPKEYDSTKIKNDRFHSVNVNFNEIRKPEDIDSAVVTARINSFQSHFNIALFWQTNFAAVNETNAPLYRYVTKRVGGQDEPSPQIDDRKLCYSTQVRRDGEEFLPNGSQYNDIPCKYALDRFSVRGHYDIPLERQALFKALIQRLKADGIIKKVIVYLSPEFYYTSQLSEFTANLARLKSLGVDGFYFDGLYRRQPWKARELAIKTRGLIGVDGFYVQHRSWDSTLLPMSSHYRIPFLDAHPSQILLGEGIKLGLDGRTPPPSSGLSLWSIYYAGRLFSNTPTALLPELRPVNYVYEENGVLNHAQSIENTLHDTILPQAQINAQISAGGAIYVPIVSCSDRSAQVAFIDKVLKNPDGSSVNMKGPLVNDYWSQFGHVCGQP